MATCSDVKERFDMLTHDDIPFDQRWEKMKPTINRLLKQINVSRSEWQQLFWDAHAATVWDENGSVFLQDALQDLIAERMKEISQSMPDSSDDLTLLKQYHQEWVVYRDQCEYLPGPFRSLEEELLNDSETGEETSIYNILLLEWGNILEKYEKRLCKAALELVKQERDGQIQDNQEYVISLKESFSDLSEVTDGDEYEMVWVKEYCAATELFYKQRADGVLLESNDTQSYMRFACKALEAEERRCEKYLQSESKHVVMELLTEVLVKNNADLIRLEVSQMVADYDHESLKLMFNLMDRVENGEQPIIKELEQQILSRGKLGLKSINVNDGEALVTFLLEHTQKQSSLIEKAFSNDTRFTTARDKAFVALLNDLTVFEKESKCPEILANHIDSLWRKKALSKKFSQDEIETRLTGLLVILKYINAKDIFMRHYKLHLTRRLVLNMSIDQAEEARFIDYLRHIGMPSDSINKLSRMFQDIKISNDLNEELKKQLNNDMMNIKILSAGAWVKGAAKIPIQLPHEVEDGIPKIVDFYNSIHSGRKLNFHPLLSHGSLVFKSKLGKYELEVTSMQIAVLNSWNRRPNQHLTLDDLLISTMLPELELRKTLLSLTQNPKLKIQLILTDGINTKDGKDFPRATKFRINRGFALIKGGKAAPRGKVSLIGRLPLVAEKVNKDEKDEIEEFRAMRCQEAIMKILKARKSMSLANLTSELIEILKAQFLPSKKLIKEQTEKLLEKEFIARDPQNPSDGFIYKA